MPEFVFDPRGGESTLECFDLKGNPSSDRDWWNTKHKVSGERYDYTVAHWALTEARFRRHLNAISNEEATGLLHLGDMLTCITQSDVIGRRIFDRDHRSYVPDFGVYIEAEVNGELRHYAVSRQLVLFAVERRKAWRVLQSKAGIENPDYRAQKALLEQADAGKITSDQLRHNGRELLASERDALSEAPA
jgi:pyruvate-ferredoxin/flavodoxin oxidoreductase